MKPLFLLVLLVSFSISIPLYATPVNDKTKIAHEAFQLAEYYKQTNDNDSASVYYEKAICYYEQLNLTDDIFKCIDQLEIVWLDFL
jgi:uncharacterized protein YozE (UPF0346 family)